MGGNSNLENTEVGTGEAATRDSADYIGQMASSGQHPNLTLQTTVMLCVEPHVWLATHDPEDFISFTSSVPPSSQGQQEIEKRQDT